jgi:hypothetical protein
MIYIIGLRIFAISMRSAILSILFILSKYPTDVLGLRDSDLPQYQPSSTQDLCILAHHW